MVGGWFSGVLKIPQETITFKKFLLYRIKMSFAMEMGLNWRKEYQGIFMRIFMSIGLW